ncbi:hypothetical protein V8G54_029989 [Vigna mungo]|uniref:Pentatricopeptide repeat-containing protein n=1 Tax=Vigna mungo TaxID=3915 RepID=A0AAQ3MVN3_VIGMU
MSMWDSDYSPYTNPTTAWNNQLRQLSKQRQYREALTLYRHMLRSSFFPNTFTFPFLFKSCAFLSLPLTASQLHAHVIRTGSKPDPYTRSSLINTYSKCSLPHHARKVFDEMPNPAICYNAMISGYSFNSNPLEAVKLFRQMRREEEDGFDVNVGQVQLPVAKSVWHPSIGNSSFFLWSPGNPPKEVTDFFAQHRKQFP